MGRGIINVIEIKGNLKHNAMNIEDLRKTVKSLQGVITKSGVGHPSINLMESNYIGTRTLMKLDQEDIEYLYNKYVKILKEMTEKELDALNKSYDELNERP